MPRLIHSEVTLRAEDAWRQSVPRRPAVEADVLPITVSLGTNMLLGFDPARSAEVPAHGAERIVDGRSRTLGATLVGQLGAAG